MKRLKFSFNPYYELLDCIVPFQRLVVNSSTSIDVEGIFVCNQEFIFNMSYDQSLIMHESRRQKASNLNRCCIIRFAKIDLSYNSGNEVIAQDSFPNQLRLDLNNTVVSLSDNGCRMCPRPIDLTQWLIEKHDTINRLNINWVPKDNANFCFAIYLVRQRTCQELTSCLLLNNLSKPSYSKELIRKKCSNCNEVDGDDIILMETTVIVSLHCPASCARMTLPVRGHYCNHLQCFDAKTFLVMNFNKPTWLCPVCDKYTFFSLLEVDRLMYDVLEDERTKYAEHIQFDKSGQWELIDTERYHELSASNVGINLTSLARNSEPRSTVKIESTMSSQMPSYRNIPLISVNGCSISTSIPQMSSNHQMSRSLKIECVPNINGFIISTNPALSGHAHKRRRLSNGAHYPLTITTVTSRASIRINEHSTHDTNNPNDSQHNIHTPTNPHLSSNGMHTPLKIINVTSQLRSIIPEVNGTNTPQSSTHSPSRIRPLRANNSNDSPILGQNVQSSTHTPIHPHLSTNCVSSPFKIINVTTQSKSGHVISEGNENSDPRPSDHSPWSNQPPLHPDNATESQPSPPIILPHIPDITLDPNGTNTNTKHEPRTPVQPPPPEYQRFTPQWIPAASRYTPCQTYGYCNSSVHTDAALCHLTMNEYYCKIQRGVRYYVCPDCEKVYKCHYEQFYEEHKHHLRQYYGKTKKIIFLERFAEMVSMFGNKREET